MTVRRTMTEPERATSRIYCWDTKSVANCTIYVTIVPRTNGAGRLADSTSRPELPCRCPAYSEAGDTVNFERIQSLAERLGERASVETVYGDPVSVGDRTVVPVASVGYGFGGEGTKTAAGWAAASERRRSARSN